MTSKIINAPTSASGIDTKKINTDFEYKYQSINTHNFEMKCKDNIAKIQKSKN
jgi:hypothetical protein